MRRRMTSVILLALVLAVFLPGLGGSTNDPGEPGLETPVACETYWNSKVHQGGGWQSFCWDTGSGCTQCYNTGAGTRCTTDGASCDPG